MQMGTTIGGVLQKCCMWMCLPDVKIFNFAIPILAPIYQPLVYTNFIQKTPNFVQIGCFYNNLLEYTQFM